MKKSIFRNRVLVVVLIAIFALSGCSGGNVAKVVPGTDAMVYLNDLSTAGARAAGTETEIAAGAYIQKTLEDMGYTVTLEPFTFDDDQGATQNSNNIIAMKTGDTEKTVIVGAHYDSMTAGDGVDDNASGIAVELEAAKVLKDVKTPETIKFIFFGAEEPGLYGSAYHVSKMTPGEIANTVLMVNFDSLIAGDFAYVYGKGDATGKARDRALEIAKENKLTLITQPGENPDYPAGTTGDWSDHAAFKAVGIPYLYFESTNWTLGEKDGYTQVDMKLGVNGEIWHTEFDKMAYMKANFPGRMEERLATFAAVTEALLKEDLNYSAAK